MSDYVSIAKNPHTKRWEPAHFMDDYFDKHVYGVQFRQARDNLVVGMESVETANGPITLDKSTILAAFYNFTGKYDRNMSNEQAAAEFFNCLDEEVQHAKGNN